MKDKKYYYVDTNTLIYLGFIDKHKKENFSFEQIKEGLQKKITNREADVNGLINLYKKVEKDEIGLIVTPTVVYETSKALLEGTTERARPNFIYMVNHCIAKMPERGHYQDYLKQVNELGKKYENNRLFTNKPKDLADQEIMAEASIDENSVFISFIGFNMTMDMFYGIRQNDPAVIDRPENIQEKLVTVNVKEFINPKYKGMRAPEIISMENLSYSHSQKDTAPVLPQDEFGMGL